MWTTALVRRFGAVSAIAVALLVGTGVALAQHESFWSSSILQADVGVVALVGLLTVLHIRRPTSRTLSYAVTTASLAVVWLGVRLAAG